VKTFQDKSNGALLSSMNYVVSVDSTVRSILNLQFVSKGDDTFSTTTSKEFPLESQGGVDTLI
jgi:hypothetical protein